ncbi:MAG: phosphoglucosamine mutase [Gammaproteobacteria bacterium]|nr:phosphoglucosamine mutase [Gammaproteobacteria bacterium]
MGRKYFGTDGIRGRVGQHPITPEFVLKLGWAIGKVLSKSGHGSVLIGKDTRISGYMFESVLEAGLSAAGVDVKLLGPMPTPGVAYLTRTFHADAGIVISASHNPYHDNGIKFFSAVGMKLPDDLEMAIEAAIDEQMTTAPELGRVERINDAAGRYIEFCKGTFPEELDLKGLKLVVDCANGATYHIAPNVFSELGAEVVAIGIEPNGTNINVDCGSTKPQSLADAVLAHNADLGIALDGDGDRLIMADENGEIVDGDELLFIMAAGRETERPEGVVGTLMTNLGMEVALKNLGIGFERAAVGDRFVMERMQKLGWSLGGESSGHLICLDKSTTGDGVVAALSVLAILVEGGKTLSELKQGMTKYPQTMINVEVADGKKLVEFSSVNAAVAAAEQALGERGRILLRPSGTEPLVRVMVEGESASEIGTIAEQLADVVRGAAITGH